MRYLTLGGFLLIGAVLSGCATPGAVTGQSDFADVNRQFEDQIVTVALSDGRRVEAAALRVERDSASFVRLDTQELVAVPTWEIASVQYLDRARNVRSTAVAGAAGGGLALGGFSLFLGQSFRDFDLGAPERSESEKNRDTALMTASGAAIGAGVGALLGLGVGSVRRNRTRRAFAVPQPAGTSPIADAERPAGPPDR